MRHRSALFALLLLVPGLLFSARAEAQRVDGQRVDGQRVDGQAVDAALDLAPWGRVLERFVTADGGVRYAALRNDAAGRADLARFVAAVGTTDPSDLSRDARIAFYANAYNALVVNAVVERWPVESVIRVEGFFDRTTHTVAGRRLTLNQLENDVLRRFGEPRVHFLISCASAGCPPLGREVIAAQNLDAQLAARARDFVRASTRIDRARHRVALSQIFEWYAADFEAGGGVRAFVASQLDPPDAAFVRDGSTTVVHTPYDWSSNARP